MYAYVFRGGRFLCGLYCFRNVFVFLFCDAPVCTLSCEPASFCAEILSDIHEFSFILSFHSFFQYS